MFISPHFGDDMVFVIVAAMGVASAFWPAGPEFELQHAGTFVLIK